MKHLTFTELKYILFGCVLFSCSTKKDTLYNRSFNSLATEYNVLFNGYNAQTKVIERLKEVESDNFWAILDIEPIKVQEDKEAFFSEQLQETKGKSKKKLFLRGVEQLLDIGEDKAKENYRAGVQAKKGLFAISEEKAVKAIQKYAMNIDGRERNPQIDEAYMLLGLSRYYSGRFIPAQDAFNYILFNYPGSDKIPQATIWLEKSNVRLGNNRIAIDNLKKLFNQEKLQKQNYADAMAVLGQAYINLKKIDSAVGYLENAAELTKIKEQKARYYFILGQLYEKSDDIPKAIEAFDKVVLLKRKIPRSYYVNAMLESLLLKYDREEVSSEFVESTLIAMEKVRGNKPFIDKIYFTYANFKFKQGFIEEGKTHYNKAIKNSQDSLLKVYSYEKLARIKLDSSLYLDMAKHYDSILMFSRKEGLTYFNYLQKRKNLEKVIYYEELLKRNDSIMKIINLPEYAKKDFFKKKINEETNKLVEIEDKNKEIEDKIKNGKFYFYNSYALERGKRDFISRWGDIPLVDNWKYTADITMKIPDVIEKTSAEAQLKSKEEELKKYLERSELIKKKSDSIRKEMNVAYYQLALFYKARFNNYEFAENRLKSLLANSPEKSLKVASQYYLYLIYKETDEKKTFFLKKEIISKDANSFYAKLLRDESRDNKQILEETVENIYEDLYKFFLQKKYEEVIKLANGYVIEFAGKEIVPKIELLKAISVGKIEGITAFRKQIEHIKVLYPNSFETEFLEGFQEKVLSDLAKSDFEKTPNKADWKITFKIDNTSKTSSQQLAKRLNEIKKTLRYYYLTVSVDRYDKNTSFVVIHGFLDKEEALGFQELLNVNKKFAIETENIVISSHNYVTLQLHKTYTKYQLTKNIN